MLTKSSDFGIRLSVLSIFVILSSSGLAKCEDSTADQQLSPFAVARAEANGKTVSQYDGAYAQASAGLYATARIAQWCNKYGPYSPPRLIPEVEINAEAMKRMPGLMREPAIIAGDQAFFWGAQWAADALLAGLAQDTKFALCADVAAHWRGIAFIDE